MMKKVIAVFFVILLAVSVSAEEFEVEAWDAEATSIEGTFLNEETEDVVPTTDVEFTELEEENFNSEDSMYFTSDTLHMTFESKEESAFDFYDGSDTFVSTPEADESMRHPIFYEMGAAKKQFVAASICLGYEEITENLTTWETGWYVVTKDVTIQKRIKVKGEVHLIICDGATLYANKGISVTKGNILNIYGGNFNEQMSCSGRLEAFGYHNEVDECAGIYAAGAAIGGRYSRNEGTQEIIKNPGTINIYSGYVSAVGNINSAGIGGATQSSGGRINIYGGFINAQGGDGAAGIGGGMEGLGCKVYIYGGYTRAIGGSNGAGIGGGRWARGSTFKIYDGYVEAQGGEGAAGIGGGFLASGGDVYFKSGTVIAIAGSCSFNCKPACGIGAGSSYGHFTDKTVNGLMKVSHGLVKGANEGYYWMNTIGDDRYQYMAIEHHDHTLEKVKKLKPTKKMAGYQAYYYCTKCGKLFSDKKAKKQILEPVVIPATGTEKYRFNIQ